MTANIYEAENNQIIQTNDTTVPESHIKWQKANEVFAILSEASNSGIVINIIDMFYHSIMLIAAGAFAFFAHYADAFIYVFKACIRATKAIGRTCFDIQFEEDVEKHTITQNLLDFFALLFFINTIVLLTALASPIAPTLAWISAFIGMVIVGYSDYYLIKVDTKQQLDVEVQKLLSLTQDYLQANQQSSPELCKITIELQQQFKIVESLHQDYQIKNKSCTLYGMLIVGVAVLLICSSATVFTTGLTCIILGILAKIASAYLAGIAIFRFHNYLKSKQENTETNNSSSFLDFLNSKHVDSEQPTSAVNLIEEFSHQHHLELGFTPQK